MATDQKELKGKLELGKNENINVIKRELNSTKNVFIAWGSEHHKYKERKSDGGCDGTCAPSFCALTLSSAHSLLESSAACNN